LDSVQIQADTLNALS